MGTTHRESVIEAFDKFRQELDEHHDRRERLIKISRDATNLSKKVIFLLHRTISEESNNSSLRIVRRGREKLREVQALYAQIRNEVQAERFWHYHKAISPGLQEYIEALSFAHYLEHGTLVSYEEVQLSLSDENGISYFTLPREDYLLGLSDVTGELMRFAISGIAQKGGRARAREVCTFVRQCKAGKSISFTIVCKVDFERFTPYVRELSKKQAVTSQSLAKIEDAVYAIVVRGSEYDIPPDMLDDIIAQSISTFSCSTSARSRPGHRDGRSGDEYEDDI
ncbi:Translin [Suillus paluster]|uniref:Translin n=1 Tax=Suillus paluster TaxID=48578 RepID=UPI001B86DB8E|nr:Translin [Suillus paluster]KAG1755019.1 Translin [Suillus paluster]